MSRTHREVDEETPLKSSRNEDNYTKGTTKNVLEYQLSADDSAYDSMDDSSEDGKVFFQSLAPRQRKEMKMADRLSVRLLAAHDDSIEEDGILWESLKLGEPSFVHRTSSQSLSGMAKSGRYRDSSHSLSGMAQSGRFRDSSHSLSGMAKSGRFRDLMDSTIDHQEQAQAKLQMMSVLTISVAVGILVAVGYGAVSVIETRPPLQPVGPYRLLERQEGKSLFDAYTFYVGKDSVGSNGFNMYVDQKQAEESGIINVTFESDLLDNIYEELEGVGASEDLEGELSSGKSQSQSTAQAKVETPKPFVYIGSSPTTAGPRNSIRLEGIRRFDRGLFILDVRHMPAGCGVWPAFWLVDEPNWPINGEIDIVEGVNYQTEAKTALHSTKGCSMDDIPLGTMSGTWDTAQGIPDAKTGIPDMTLRYAQNCFVYDPHQWLNQGCVAVDQQGGTIGVPLNEKGGGVYVLEWDPSGRFIRSWVFTPHSSVPGNLVQAIRTAGSHNPVEPNPEEWPLPYAYFAIGQGTNCAGDHFRRMHLVLNTAFCGSVAGNRYNLDCTKEQTTKHPTCNDYIRSNPKEIQDETYWKIRGVYVYEREWERTWIT